MRTHRLQPHDNKGFTLIETLVSLAIFSMVMVVAGGIILSVISSNRQNQAVNVVVNNLNYSIESMVRDIKTGFEYKCDYPTADVNDFAITEFKAADDNCTIGTPISNITLISTISGPETVVRYEKVQPIGGAGYIKKIIYTETGGVVEANTYPLTDQTNIDITQLSFRVNPGAPLYIDPNSTVNINAVQPSVSLLIKGTAKVNAINISDFFIQTFISQRLPNFI